MMIRKAFQTIVDELGASSPEVRGELSGKAIELVRARNGWSHRDPRTEALKSPVENRYIVIPRAFVPSAGPGARGTLKRLGRELGEAVLRSDAEDGTKVMRLSPLEAEVLRERFSALIVEQDVQHSLARTPLIGEIEPIMVPASGGRTITIRVRGGGRGIPGARVILIPDAQRDDGYTGDTDENGELRLAIRDNETSFAKVLVVPRADFWPRVWLRAASASTMELSVLPLDADRAKWGVADVAASARGEHRGQGIKVAIIDTGLAPHPGLLSVARSGRNFIVGEPAAGWDKDLDGHGTHCAGVVADIAPGVEIHGLRVFGGEDGGGWAADIAAAILWAMDNDIDIINLSLASAAPSKYLMMTIKQAIASGVLCVAAAGNDGGPVGYPARLEGVIAVSAIGKRRTYPVDSIHRNAETEAARGDYFFASFSNHGPEIDLAAPGVAITSTVPPTGFASWDGTSMACPHVAGVAAIALDRLSATAPLPRTPTRVDLLTERLIESAEDLGMARDHQGAGRPRIDRL
jgi:hypothetical protein